MAPATVLDLLRDPGLRRKMGQEGQKRARAHFDLKAMTKRYEDLYLA
jgi:glycosyltransferase involved in cell wall biosynthesis